MLTRRRETNRRRWLGPVAAGVFSQVGLGCGPSFPPYWQLATEATDAFGNLDPSGKLRILALSAEPPEAQPGQTVQVTALITTHPNQGERQWESGVEVTSLRPKGLSVLYRLCKQPETLSSPLPCGLFPPTQDFVELPNRTEQPTLLAIPFAEFQTPSPFGNPYQLIVTLFAADSVFAGGAWACADAAQRNGGVSPVPNHCVIAIKRVKVNRTDSPNHNPKIRRLLLGGDEQSLIDLATGGAQYPRLGSDVPDGDRPTLQLVVERTAESEEQEPSPTDPAVFRAELLTTSLFVSAGSVDSGRGNFIDLDCQGDCIQRLTTVYPWRPAAALAAQESPDNRSHFALVLRDDRGGTDFAVGIATAR